MGCSKSVLRGKYMAIQSYLKKQDKSQINNLRRKEITKIRSEINEKEMKETIAKNNKTKSWFFEKIKKLDKP